MTVPEKPEFKMGFVIKAKEDGKLDIGITVGAKKGERGFQAGPRHGEFETDIQYPIFSIKQLNEYLRENYPGLCLYLLDDRSNPHRRKGRRRA